MGRISGGGSGEVHHGRSCGDQRASGSSGRDPSPVTMISMDDGESVARAIRGDDGEDDGDDWHG